MFKGAALALGLSAATHGWACGVPVQVTEVEWTIDDPGFGGLSGIEVSEDGATFLAISDVGLLYRARFVRDEDGHVIGVRDAAISTFTDEFGVSEGEKKDRDAEALTLFADGGYAISIEGRHRVLVYKGATSKPYAIAAPTSLSSMKNKGMEALASLADGTLLAFPEGSPSLIEPFSVYSHTPQNGWRVLGQIERRGGYRPVGADVLEDRTLFVLSRAFNGIGFSNRISCYSVHSGTLGSEQIIVSSAFGTWDNLEGLSVWKDKNGAIRMTMVSDDNFSRFQRTQIVEVTLQ